jgi:hypothetical protein
MLKMDSEIKLRFTGKLNNPILYITDVHLYCVVALVWTVSLYE